MTTSIGGRPEDSTVSRPAYFVNTTCPGSDVAAGIAGAMAAGAIVFNKSCPGISLKICSRNLYVCKNQTPCVTLKSPI